MPLIVAESFGVHLFACSSASEVGRFLKTLLNMSHLTHGIRSSSHLLTTELSVALPSIRDFHFVAAVEVVVTVSAVYLHRPSCETLGRAVVGRCLAPVLSRRYSVDRTIFNTWVKQRKRRKRFLLDSNSETK